jgi:hypothetical protein
MVCALCGGKGQYPLVRHGRIVPHTFVDCDCKQDEPEHFHKNTPDIIDFPVSWDFYRHFARHYGWEEPPDNMVKPPEKKSEKTSLYKKSYKQKGFSPAYVKQNTSYVNNQKSGESNKTKGLDSLKSSNQTQDVLKTSGKI